MVVRIDDRIDAISKQTFATGSNESRLCKNINRPRCESILQNSNFEISQI
jgi:hypothetical protein